MKLRQLAFVIALAAAFFIPMSATAEMNQPFRHFVSFQFKEGTSEATISELVSSFLELKGKIDTIVDLEWETAENDDRNDGFTHSFLVTFNDAAGLEIYAPHPAHQAFVAKLKPHLEKIYVFDYTAKR